MGGKRHSLAQEVDPFPRGALDGSQVHDDGPVLREVHLILQRRLEQEESPLVQIAEEDGVLKRLPESLHPDVNLP